MENLRFHNMKTVMNLMKKQAGKRKTLPHAPKGNSLMALTTKKRKKKIKKGGGKYL